MENKEYTQSVFTSLSPAGRFWMFTSISLICLGLFSVISTLLILPFSDANSLEELGSINLYNNKQTITGLKLAQIITVLGTFVLPSFIFSLLIQKGSLELRNKPKFYSSILGIVFIICCIPAINLLASWNEQIQLPAFLSKLEAWIKNSEQQVKVLTEAFLQMDSMMDLLINLFIMAALAAFAEEVFFRGIIQKILADWTKNKHYAIWITAIVFSAFHMQFYGFIPRMLLGLALGYLFFWSNSIWLPIIVHFTNNALAVIAHYLVLKGFLASEIETIGANYFNYWHLISFIGFIAIWAIWYIEKKSFKRTNA